MATTGADSLALLVPANHTGTGLAVYFVRKVRSGIQFRWFASAPLELSGMVHTASSPAHLVRSPLTVFVSARQQPTLSMENVRTNHTAPLIHTGIPDSVK